MAKAIQFPLGCESIPRSKLITTDTAVFCNSSCASCWEGNERARWPLAPQAKMPVLLFGLHAIADRNSFSFRHWTKISPLRCRHPIRPCFIFFGRLRGELEFDKLAGAVFALDRN